MKLADLRRLTTKKNARIRFRLQNGMECILNEHGIAEIPELKSIPDFNLEEQFALVNEFVMETAGLSEKVAAKEKTQRLTREQMSNLAAPPSAVAAHDDHEDN
jgi:hypothetical protein